MSECDRKYIISVEEVVDFGLVTLKANFVDTKICDLVETVTDTKFPEVGRISISKKLSVGWMSTDEIAILLKKNEAEKMVRRLVTKLKSYHNLCMNMSDSRKCFKLYGYGWREVLSKGTPANLNPKVFTIGSFRRTRIANVAVAIWAIDRNEAYVFSMSSVGSFMFDWLQTANLESGHLKYY